MKFIRILFKSFLALVVVIVFGASLATLYALFTFDRAFEAPMPDLKAVTDSAVIAHGHYLVYGPAHCSDCHAPPALKSKSDSGQEVEMTGGYAINTYLGSIRPGNITSDIETGIGGISDGQLARFFRYGVDHRGQVGLPIMMFADLSNEDIVAIISFLRTLPPVHNVVEPSQYNLLGKITRAYFLEPFAPQIDPPPYIPHGLTVEYGGYLVNTVANCASCHTERNMQTGEYIGPKLAGGMIFNSKTEPITSVISQNLTPDSTTGRVTKWGTAGFTQRFKAGSLVKWSPMPWGPFSRMSEEDLGAIYLYLMQLNPVYRVNMLPASKVP